MKLAGMAFWDWGLGMGPDLDLAVSGIGYLIVAPKVPPRA